MRAAGRKVRLEVQQAQWEDIASWGSKPELLHASVQRSAGEGRFRKIAGFVIMVHPKKKAPSPVDRKRTDARVMAIICLHKSPVHVVVGHLPKKGPAGGPTLSVRNLLPSPSSRALSHIQTPANVAWQQCTDEARQSYTQTQRLQRRASDWVSSTAIARWCQLPSKTRCDLKALGVTHPPWSLEEGRSKGRNTRREQKTSARNPP